MNDFGVVHIIFIAVVLFFVVRPMLKGYREVRNERSAGDPVKIGDGNFATEVVGESKYQRNLIALCGSRGPDGVNKHFVAELVPEDANPYDPQAMRVDIEGKTVGYLSRAVARSYRQRTDGGQKMRCNAVVRGGWDRGADDQGNFGVWLDIST